jgi:hypothetical protein
MGTVRFADLQSRPTEVLDLTSLTVGEFHQLVVQSKYSNSHGYTRVVPCLTVAKPYVYMPPGGPVRGEGTT